VPVHDGEQAPVLVVHVRVGGLVRALAGGHGDPAGQVREPGAPPEPGHLRHHPAVAVVGVGRLDHAVGVDHRGDPAVVVRLVPPVAGRHQHAAVGVRVRDAAAVGGLGGGDPVAGPGERHRPAAGVGERVEAAVGVGQPDGGAGPVVVRHRPPGVVELPGAPVEPVHRQAGRRRRHPGGHAEHAPVSGALPGEQRPLAVRAGVLGAVLAGVQPGVGPGRPAGAEAAGPVGPAVVRAAQGEPRGEGAGRQVGLGDQEVAAGRVHRVVGVAGGGREPVRDGAVEGDRLAAAAQTGGAQAGRDRRVGQPAEAAVAAGGAERGGDPGHPLRVGLVQLDVPAEAGDQRGGVEVAPAGAAAELVVDGPQAPVVAAQFVVGRPAAADERVEVVGACRAGAHRRLSRGRRRSAPPW
jgi:hypothetical protein